MKVQTFAGLTVALIFACVPLRAHAQGAAGAMPGAPSAPSVPGAPSMPSVPGAVPGMPSVPGASSMPGAVPGMPSVPGAPAMAGAPSMPRCREQYPACRRCRARPRCRARHRQHRACRQCRVLRRRLPCRVDRRCRSLLRAAATEEVGFVNIGLNSSRATPAARGDGRSPRAPRPQSAARCRPPARCP